MEFLLLAQVGWWVKKIKRQVKKKSDEEG
ncbi:hypothetical protein ZOSMA_27G01040 [Zostera marina]|uniref:Uncharacterized protein n=1 Tax=Zostera marina TaxID=29655 RepID=A0A0K9PDK6_ZOSMR|nr:hypothetical protein ZOSMA_27G01040 [Zostera marina]